VKRSAGVLAGVMIALATSLFFSSAQADSRDDWIKCLSGAKIRSDERISSCTAALAARTDYAEATRRAYYNRGTAYFANGDLEAAVADFSQAVQLFPNDAQAYQARAAAYQRRRDFDLAIADDTRVIEINPKSSTGYAYYTYYAYAHRADVYADEGNFDRSIADSSKAIEIDPKLKFAYCIRGHAYVAKGEVEPAIADFNQAIQLASDYEAAYDGRARAYRLKGDLDLAMADADQVIRLDPKDAQAYRARAVIYWQSGSLSKSLTDLDEAARLDPKSAYVALWREIVARRNNQPSRFAEAAIQLDMTKWPAPIVNLFLGVATPEQVRAAAENDPQKRKSQVCETNFFTAELALLHGSREDATRLLEQAMADCPKNSAADIELKALTKNP
jgi:tetratricopeptide (TPR) repeat protein